MPRMNRVNPFGELILTSMRGSLMGNRGCLHDSRGYIIKRSARPAWITCTLSFKGRKRELMSPRQYTELFFLDEATALTAGHRPCGTCQRERLDEFRTRWVQAVPEASASLADIDRQLHRERLAGGGALQFANLHASALIEGSFVVSETSSHTAFLVWNERLYAWTPQGYRAPIDLMSARYAVITPPSICRIYASGFQPGIHPSVKVPLSGSSPAGATQSIAAKTE